MAEPVSVSCVSVSSRQHTLDECDLAHCVSQRHAPHLLTQLGSALSRVSVTLDSTVTQPVLMEFVTESSAVHDASEWQSVVEPQYSHWVNELSS